MRRHFPSAALILGLSLFHVLSLGQDKAGWQAGVDTFEAKGARQLLPVHQLLLSELEAAARQPATAGDPMRQAELEASLAVVRRDHSRLQDGRVPHPDLAEAEKDAFLRAANGGQWALAGTRNLKRIGVTMGALHSFDENGRDLNELSRQHVLPGMFANRRNDGDGWTYYLISPALDQAHCVVTTQMLEGRLVRGENLPFAKPPAPMPAITPDPAAAKTGGLKEDLHVLLGRRYHQQLLDHERRLIRLLQDRLAEAAGDDRDALELRLMQARLALAVGEKGELAPVPPESQAAFHARLSGCRWTVQRMRMGHQLAVENGQMQTMDAAGQVVDSLPTETLWPGVLRARAPDGTLLMAVFSAGLERVLTFPVRSQFPARRVR